MNKLEITKKLAEKDERYNVDSKYIDMLYKSMYKSHFDTSICFLAQKVTSDFYTEAPSVESSQSSCRLSHDGAWLPVKVVALQNWSIKVLLGTVLLPRSLLL